MSSNIFFRFFHYLFIEVARWLVGLREEEKQCLLILLQKRPIYLRWMQISKNEVIISTYIIIISRIVLLAYISFIHYFYLYFENGLSTDSVCFEAKKVGVTLIKTYRISAQTVFKAPIEIVHKNLCIRGLNYTTNNNHLSLFRRR